MGSTKASIAARFIDAENISDAHIVAIKICPIVYTTVSVNLLKISEQSLCNA